jgi:hypothetical protein
MFEGMHYRVFECPAGQDRKETMTSEPSTVIKPKKSAQRERRGTRDGLFQKNGWWWIDYYDADGKRHRKKAAPDYNTAKTIYRDTMTKIAKGEVLGVREEGIRLRDFVDKRYWPSVSPTLAPSWAERSRGILEPGDHPGLRRRSPFRDPPGSDRALVRWPARERERLDGEQGARPPQASARAGGRVGLPQGEPGRQGDKGEGAGRPRAVPDCGRARRARQRRRGHREGEGRAGVARPP